jgi:hypothetical protein
VNRFAYNIFLYSHFRIPHKCSIMLTKDAEQVFPAPNFKVYGKESDVSIIKMQ